MDKKHEEVLKRMRMMGLYKQVLMDFEKDDVLYYSERTPLGGILYWVSNEPEWQEKIREIEKEHNILVYHATHEHTMFGEMLDLFYVGNDEEEWEM